MAKRHQRSAQTPRELQSRAHMPRIAKRGGKRLRDEFTLRTVKPTQRESLSPTAHLSSSMKRLEKLIAKGGASLWEALSIAEILAARTKPGTDKHTTANLYLRHIRATLHA